MAFLQVHDGTGLRIITGPPGGESYSTDADVPRSVGDVQRSGDAFVGWDDDWQYPTLVNGWTNYNGSPQHAVARYRRLPGGMVIMEGLVTGGTANSVIFYLPTTHRPIDGRYIINTHTAVGNVRLQINHENGEVYVPYTGSSSWHSIHCAFHTGVT